MSKAPPSVMRAIDALRGLALDPGVPDKLAAFALQTARQLQKMAGVKADDASFADGDVRAPTKASGGGRKPKVLEEDLKAVKAVAETMSSPFDRDAVLQELGWSKDDKGKLIVLGRALSELGYRGQRKGQQPNRRWEFTKAS
ncbi:MAG: hypothetical protein IT381_10455 [Deltaproteobacteria bacterium]|nr:hypothetical protein [Deltaproteobacteria bacterium]